jgi:hypothetical protein
MASFVVWLALTQTWHRYLTEGEIGPTMLKVSDVSVAGRV